MNNSEVVFYGKVDPEGFDRIVMIQRTSDCLDPERGRDWDGGWGYFS